MKCFSRQQCETLLRISDVAIAANDDLILAKLRHRITVDVPSRPLNLARFAARLVEWLPDGLQRVLWLSVWQSYPAQAAVLFEKIRNGCGETRPLGEAPCHVFEKFVGDSDIFYNEAESAILGGLVFLMLTFDWSGYVLSIDNEAHVFLTDGSVVFCTSDKAKLAEVSAVVGEFDLASTDLGPG
jgi:hypothetical protein